MLNLPQSGYSKRSDSQAEWWTRKNESNQERGSLNYFALIIITLLSSVYLEFKCLGFGMTISLVVLTDLGNSLIFISI